MRLSGSPGVAGKTSSPVAQPSSVAKFLGNTAAPTFASEPSERTRETAAVATPSYFCVPSIISFMLPERSITKMRFGASVVTSRNMLPQSPWASGAGAARASSTQPSRGGGGGSDESPTGVVASSTSLNPGGSLRALEHEASTSAQTSGSG